MLWLWMSVGWACMEPVPFEVDASVSPTEAAEILGVEVIVGRWDATTAPTPDCAGWSWLEVTVDTADDVGVVVGIYDQPNAVSPTWGAAGEGPWRTDETMVLTWQESDSDAAQTLHFGLLLTPLDVAGGEGQPWEIEVYDTERGAGAGTTTGGGGSTTGGGNGAAGGGNGSTNGGSTTTTTTSVTSTTSGPSSSTTDTAGAAMTKGSSSGCQVVSGGAGVWLWWMPVLVGLRRRGGQL